MNLPIKKLFFSLIILFLIFSFLPLIPVTTTLLDPTTANNQFLERLTSNLHQQSFDYHHLQTNFAWQQVSFFIDQTQIVASTQKKPEDQVLALSQILKHAKINHQTVQIIDLSLDHPYATLQNN